MAFELREDGVWEIVGEKSKQITTRSVRVVGWARELSMNEARAELEYIGVFGQHKSCWVPEATLRNQAALSAIPEFPMPIGSAARLSAYLLEQLTGLSALNTPVKQLSARVGWLSREEGQRLFYLPDVTNEIEYVGSQPWPADGDLAYWSMALAHLQFGQAHTALTVLALSAAAPLVRPLAQGKHRRRPVIGLVAPSSTGKGTLINAALALWALPPTLTLPASSTYKGLQDLSVLAPDLPVFADELQQVQKGLGGSSNLEAIMYFLGNGQRRVTSSQEQVATGGEQRFGVGFYASELPVMLSLQTGAQYRAIECQGPPLPDAETASLLAEATQHVGVVGRALTHLVNTELNELLAHAERRLDELQAAHDQLRGDDAFTLALVETGVALLAQVCEVELPTAEVMAFLIELIGQQRQATVSPEETALIELVQKILGAEWTADVLRRHGEFIARRGPDYLDLNQHSDFVKAALREWANHRVFPKRWAERGWMDCNTNRHTWNTRVGQDTVRLWRINNLGLRLAGVEDQDSDPPEAA